MENQNETNTKEAVQNPAAPSLPKLLSPEEQVKQFGRGKMKLYTPIQDGEKKYEELEWDFLALTGAEYCDAMDRDIHAGNTFRITSTQAFNLFAAAAGKATPGIDATDVRRGLGVMDTTKAVQLATVFFTASSREGNKRISNE